MALHRGIQSAIFYYLSCAPCTGYSYRKKRRKEATRDRAHKRALEENNPGLYRHPSPFATNPHWQEEMELGPATSKRKGHKSNLKAVKTSGTQNSGGSASQLASTVELGLSPNSDGGGKNDSKWNLKRYQREDEELNLDGSRDGDTSGLNRPPTARTAQTSRSATSYYSVNPPVNDLHPAIVTRYESKEDVMWMLQPPPTARVMNGKERANRSRSDSGGSRLSSRRGGGDANKLSRQVSERILDQKLKNGEEQPISISRVNSARTANAPKGQRHDRDPRSALTPVAGDSPSSSDEASSQPRRRRQKPAPIHVSSDSSTPSATTVIRRNNNDTTSTDSSFVTANPSRSLRPPVLSTVVSESHYTRSSDSLPLRDRTSRRAGLLTNDSSLNVLQELVPTGSLLNVKTSTKPPSFEARISLPPADSGEDRELQAGKDFDGWYAEHDFHIPQWAVDRTTRDVSYRWSMDF
ncbi:hypothetical protein H2203_003211 [Taxawa tesnikishii (nom. ined.)]|nr:hypothetical protein H2203_003211 [Dothideales sp. JES 119]